MQIATLAGKTLDFDDNFSLELLDRTGEPMLSCRAITIHGRRLIARVPSRVVVGTAVSIDCRNGQLLGEILGHWSDGDANHAAIELCHAITTGGTEEARHYAWQRSAA